MLKADILLYILTEQMVRVIDGYIVLKAQVNWEPFDHAYWPSCCGPHNYQGHFSFSFTVIVRC